MFCSPVNPGTEKQYRMKLSGQHPNLILMGKVTDLWVSENHRHCLIQTPVQKESCSEMGWRGSGGCLNDGQLGGT